jgi:DNA invertase Pin-like site-specific DNA recombinase
LSDSLTPLPATIPPGSIVDTYLRDSGGESQDRSVSRQLEAIKEYCVRHGLKLRRIYKDAAKSGGSTAGRDDFDRMIASTRDESSRPVAILLWNYARFARDLDDSTYYKALLRSKRGIIIHSLTDHIPEGPYGRFVEILIDISNEEKRRQTSIDTKDGLRSIVAQGAIPGVPPRGFKREPMVTINPRTGQERKNHRWVPDPKYINRIRKAFQMRAAGASLDEIQKACKLFSTVNSYATFWKNPIYYGTLVYAGETFEKYCESIVTKTLWDKVQLIQQGFAQGKNIKSGDLNHPRRQASDFLLSGIARCARCGSPLYGRTSHQKTGYKYQSYLCTLAYRKRGACSKGRIPKPAFEAAVINTLVDEIYKKENVEEMHRLLAEQDAGLASEINDQRREILARVTSNKKMLNNIADAIMENGSSPTLQSRLKTLEHEKLELEMQLNELDSTLPAPIPALSPALLERRLKRITTILKGKDEAAKKTLLRGLIAYVEVEREEKFLKGTIYVYPPEADDDNIDPDDFSNSPQGGDDVPTPHHPSGPHLSKWQKAD